MKELFYDLEIINCIPPITDAKYKYCEGWKDFHGMGISVCGVYIGWEDKYKAFVLDKTINVYAELDIERIKLLILKSDRIIGFNSISFDDKLMAANNIKCRTNYDLLCEIRKASGQPPFFQKEFTRRGYNLDAMAQANLSYKKTGSGATAPELWQNEMYDAVISYCLNDVRITLDLYKKRKQLIDPTNGGLLVLAD